jgi:protein-disulfide isomerase
MEKHTTHWPSFWHGFTVALAVILFGLLGLTITDHLSFDAPQKNPGETTKKTSPEKKDTTQSLEEAITSLGLDAEKIRTCVSEKTYADKVQSDSDSGTRSGVKGTPHSFVLIDQAIYEIPGAYDEKGMRTFFDDLLAGKNPKAKDISGTTELTPIADNDWTYGKNDARITVIMYSDMDCPYCKKFHTSISHIIPDYPDTIRWVFRHMPIDASHPHAREKAETAECVGAIGGKDKFWKFLDLMYAQK